MLRRAMRRAADREIGLDLTIEVAESGEADLAEVLDAFEGRDLMVGLLRDEELAGVVIMTPPIWSAFVEMQTVRRVLSRGETDRLPKRSDAVLCGSVITRLLDEVTSAAAGTMVQGWLDGLRLGAQITLRRMVELTLPAGRVRRIRLGCSYEGLSQPGHLSVIATVAHESGDRICTDDAASWKKNWRGVAEKAPARLEAILHRMPLSIATFRDMKPGMVLPLPGATVSGLRLETSAGLSVCSARLGCINGHRAVRLETPPATVMQDIGLGGEAQDTGMIGADPMGEGASIVDEAAMIGASDIGGQTDHVPDSGGLPEHEPLAGGLPDLAMGDGLPDLGVDAEGGENAELPEIAPPLEGLPDLGSGAGGEGGFPDLGDLGAGELPEPSGFDLGDLPPLDLPD